MGIQLRGNAVKSSGTKALVNEVLSLNENDEVPTVIFGDPETFFDDCRDMSNIARHKNAFYHAQLTLTADMEAHEIEKIFNAWRDEFDPKHEHEIFVVQHDKARADGTSCKRHFHCILGMTAPDGTSLDITNNFARNEKIARVMEVHFGQQLTKGAHNRAVLYELEKHPEHAEVVAAIKEAKLTEGARPRARYGSKNRAQADRLGFELPKFANALAKLNQGDEHYHRDLAKTLKHFGVDVRKGDRRNVLIVERNGKMLSNLNKLLGLKSKDTADLMNGLMAAWKAEQPAQQPKQQQEDTNVRQSQAPREQRAATTRATANAGREAELSKEERQRIAREKNERSAARRARKKAAWNAAKPPAVNAGGDQVGHKRDQDPAQRSPEPGPRQHESHRSDAARNAEDVRENRVDGDVADELPRDHDRVDNKLKRDESRDRVPSRSEAEDVALIEPFDAAEKPSRTAPDRPSLTRMEVAQAASGWLRNGAAIKLNTAPRDEPLKPLPGVQTNAKSGPAQPRRPRMDMGHSPRLQASSVGGPVVVDITRMDAGEALKLINEANARSAGLKM